MNCPWKLLLLTLLQIYVSGALSASVQVVPNNNVDLSGIETIQNPHPHKIIPRSLSKHLRYFGCQHYNTRFSPSTPFVPSYSHYGFPHVYGFHNPFGFPIPHQGSAHSPPQQPLWNPAVKTPLAPFTNPTTPPNQPGKPKELSNNPPTPNPTVIPTTKPTAAPAPTAAPTPTTALTPTAMPLEATTEDDEPLAIDIRIGS